MASLIVVGGQADLAVLEGIGSDQLEGVAETGARTDQTVNVIVEPTVKVGSQVALIRLCKRLLGGSIGSIRTGIFAENRTAVAGRSR